MSCNNNIVNKYWILCALGMYGPKISLILRRLNFTSNRRSKISPLQNECIACSPKTVNICYSNSNTIRDNIEPVEINQKVHLRKAPEGYVPFQLKCE